MILKIRLAQHLFLLPSIIFTLMEFTPDKLEATLLKFPSLRVLDLSSLKDSLNRLYEGHRLSLIEYVNDKLVQADQIQQTLIHNIHKMIFVFCEMCSLETISEFTNKNIPSILDALPLFCQLSSEYAEIPLSLDVAISQVAGKLGIVLPKKERRKSSAWLCLGGMFVHSLSWESIFLNKMVWTKNEFLAKFTEFDPKTENWLERCKLVDNRFLDKEESERANVQHFKKSDDYKERFHMGLDDQEYLNLASFQNLAVIIVALTNDRGIKGFKETSCVELAAFLQGKIFLSGGDNGPGNIRRKYLHKRLMSMKHEETELLQNPLGKHCSALINYELREDCSVKVQSKKLRRSHMSAADVPQVFPIDPSEVKSSILPNDRGDGSGSLSFLAVDTGEEFNIHESAGFYMQAGLPADHSCYVHDSMGSPKSVNLSTITEILDDDCFEMCDVCGQFYCECDNY